MSRTAPTSRKMPQPTEIKVIRGEAAGANTSRALTPSIDANTMAMRPSSSATATVKPEPWMAWKRRIEDMGQFLCGPLHIIELKRGFNG